MHGTYERRVSEQKEIERRLLQGDARICTGGNFGKCWKALFPVKPAEELASRIGCSVRTAAYEISGEHQPSSQSIRALVDLCVPPWR